MGVVDSVVNGVFGLFGGHQDYKNDLKLMAKQHEYELEMLQKNAEAQKALFQYQFDANNAYNDPSAQVSRLVNAGLSPNLMYSNGSGASGVANGAMPSVSGGTSVGIPSSSHYSRAAQHLGDAFKYYVDTKRLENESKQADAEVGNLEAKTLSELLEYQRNLKKDTPDWHNVNSLIQQRIVDMQKTEQETKTEEQRTKEAELRVKIAEFEKDAASYLPEQAAKTIAKIVADIDLSKASAANERASAEYYRETAKLQKAQRLKVNIETAKLIIDSSFAKELNEASLSKLNAEVASIMSETNVKNAEYTLKRLDIVFRSIFGDSNDYISSVAKTLVIACYGTDDFYKAAKAIKD